MKKLILFVLIFTTGFKLSAHANDELDSLKQKLQLTADSLKGPVYTQIASKFIHFDTVLNKNLRYYYQKEALNYTMLALHSYSSTDDTLGLRTSFNNLSKIYKAQGKFSQAKWFTLQSTAISRQRNDTANIVSSLIELSTIKTEIGDYKLAMRDLDEALALAVKNSDPKNESAVQLGYAGLYREMKEFSKATIAIQRHEFIEDSLVHKAQQDSLTLVNMQDYIMIKKQDSIIAKKKAYISSYKKSSKTSSAKRIASL